MMTKNESCLYGDAMLVSFWEAQINMAASDQQIKIEVIFILKQRMFRQQNLKTSATFFGQYIRASPKF